MSGDRSFAGILACFFLSGFAALLYQTAWMREFAFVFGTSELAVAIVLAGYMAGLSLGAAVAGRFIHRIRRPVRVYGWLELGIGVSALALPFMLDFFTQLAAVVFSSPDGPPQAGGVGFSLYTLVTAFAVLLIPTALMGATLPLLSRYAVRRDEELGRRVGALYAINTLGAIGGTLVAGFVLLPGFGLFRTVLVGVAINACVFLLVATLARRGDLVAKGEPSEKPHLPVRRVDLVLPLVFVSGVASFGYEVLWTRLLSQILGGSTYAFSTMLASFLAGITLGSLLASRKSERHSDAVRGFAASQVAIAGFSLLAFQFLDRLPSWVVRFDAGVYGGVHPSDALFAMALLLPSTLAIGATFPFAVRICARGVADAGRASARVYAWNTVGAIAGAMGAGFFMIPSLGFSASAGLLVALNLALAVTASLCFTPRVRPVLGLAALGLVLLWLWPPQAPWNLLRFAPLTRQVRPGEIVYFDAGRSANVMVTRRGGEYFVSTNGLPEAAISTVPDAKQLTNRWLSAFPTLARPDARELLVVGLGGGVLVEEVPPSIESIDVVELEPSVVEANRLLAERRFIDPLSDPRIRIIENDARAALARTSKRYDGILSQPSHPWTAGASHLYTREFFELAREHLEPGGVFVQWIGFQFVDRPLLRTLVATLLDVFAYVRVYSPPPYGAVLFVASDEPLDVEATAARAIAMSPEAFGKIGIQAPEDLFVSLELDEQGAREFARGGAVSTDDENILQVRSPRILARSVREPVGTEVFAPYDPLKRTISGMDGLYLATRFLKLRPQHPRLPRLAEAFGDDPEARLVRLFLDSKRDRVSRLRAFEALSSEGVDDDRIAQVRALLLAPRLRSGPTPEDRVRVAALPDPARAVAEGWQSQEDFAALSRLEPRLARVRPGELLYNEAVRLRARWRLASGDPEKAAEAASLLAPLLVGRGGTFEDFILRGQLAALSGQWPTAIWSFERAASRARGSRGLRVERLERVRRALLDLPVVGEERADRDRVVSQIDRWLSRKAAAGKTERGDPRRRRR